jgi:4-amino-4-deoxy-L-arabinose transferase-like glycosyltransferase
LLLLFSFSLIFIIRFAFLSADPPPDTHAHFFTDEGWKTRNARNKVLFDKWIMDDHRNVINSPLHHLGSYVSFRLFGTGLTQARLVSAVSGYLTIILLYLFVRRGWNRKGALLSACLAGFCFVFTTYHRLALQETMITFFLILTLYLWQKGKDTKWFYMFSGISASLAYLTKANGIVIVPIIIALYVFENYFQIKDKKEKNKSAIIYFIFSSVTILLSWKIFSKYLFSVSTHSSPLNYAHQLSSSLLDFLKYIAIFPTSPIFGQMPVLTTLSLIYILYIICSIKNSSRSFISNLSSLEFASISWFLLGSIFIAVMHFQPDRRYIVLIPPMSILASKILLEVRCISPKALFKGYKANNDSWYFQWASYLLLLIPVYYLLTHAMMIGNKVLISPGYPGLISCIIVFLISLFFMIIKPKSQIICRLKEFLILFSFVFFFTHITLTHWIVQVSRKYDITTGVEKGLYFGSAILITFILTVIAALVISAIKFKKRQGLFDFELKLPGKVATTIIIIFFLTNGYSYLSWAKNMSFTMVDTSRELRKYVNENSTIIGGVADTLAIETKAYAVPTLLGMNNNPVGRFRPDYALIRRFKDGRWNPLPEYLSGTKMKSIKKFMVCPTKNEGEYRFIVELYKVEKQFINVYPKIEHVR